MAKKGIFYTAEEFLYEFFERKEDSIIFKEKKFKSKENLIKRKPSRTA